MKIAVLSDVHANLLALQAVLDALPPEAKIWCLGDMVDYYADPVKCVEVLCADARTAVDRWLLGNHDDAVCQILHRPQGGLVSSAGRTFADFDDQWLPVLDWTSQQLQGTAQAIFLEERPRGPLPVTVDGLNLILAHASPSPDPYDVLWRYVANTRAAQDVIQKAVQTSIELAQHLQWRPLIALVGHAHEPAIFREGPSWIRTPPSWERLDVRDPHPEKPPEPPPVPELEVEDPPVPGGLSLVYRIRRDDRLIVRLGSVGQPRDGGYENRAACLLVDTRTQTLHFWRIPYNWKEAGQALRNATGCAANPKKRNDMLCKTVQLLADMLGPWAETLRESDRRWRKPK